MQMITSKDNQRVKNLIKLQSSARFRRQSGLFLAEGLRVCRDAMLSRAVIKTLYLTETALEKYSDKLAGLIDYAEEPCCSLTRYSPMSATLRTLRAFCAQ